MTRIILLWLLSGPIAGLLILAFSFKGSSGSKRPEHPVDDAAPMLEPLHPGLH